jgi:hypothetical protein
LAASPFALSRAAAAESKRQPPNQEALAHNRATVQKMLAQYAQKPEGCTTFFSEPRKVINFVFDYTAGSSRGPSGQLKALAERIIDYGACQGVALKTSRGCDDITQSGQSSGISKQCVMRMGEVEFLRSAFMAHAPDMSACERSKGDTAQGKMHCSRLIGVLGDLNGARCQGDAMCLGLVRALKAGKSDFCPRQNQKADPVCVDMANFVSTVQGGTPCRSWECAPRVTPANCSYLQTWADQFCKALPALRGQNRERFDEVFIKIVFGG